MTSRSCAGPVLAHRLVDDARGRARALRRRGRDARGAGRGAGAAVTPTDPLRRGCWRRSRWRDCSCRCGLRSRAPLVVLAAMLADGLSVRDAPAHRAQAGWGRSRAACRAAVDPTALHARRPPRAAAPAGRPRRSRSTRRAERHERCDGEIVPMRRGRHSSGRALRERRARSGLARWHHRAGAPAELLVYPDLPMARRLALRLRQGRAAPAGRLRRGPLGLGTDFESIRDYSPDDDIRQVNWRASARLGRPMSNQYRVEQDRDVVCLLDSGRLMARAARAGHAARRRARRDAPRSRWWPTSSATAVGRSPSTRKSGG